MENCQHLNIPVHIFESRIFEIVDENGKGLSVLYMCKNEKRFFI